MSQNDCLIIYISVRSPIKNKSNELTDEYIFKEGYDQI